MADFPNIEPDLEEIGLIANNQVYDSILTGQVQTASLSGAKWTCAPTFSNRNGKEARDLRAFIFGQNGVSGRFNYYPASIDNVGTHAGLGVADGAGQTGSTLETTGWDANQPLLFAAGDYITANGEMKMVTADVGTTGDRIEYDETNYMPSPFDPSGWYGNITDPDLSYIGVTEENPSGESFVGEFEYVGTSGTATYTFSSNVAYSIGDKLYTSCLLGKNGYSKIRHIVQEYPSATVVSDFRYDFITDTVERNTAGVNYKKIDINSDYCIVQTEYISAFTGEHRGGIWGDPNTGSMPVGAKLKMQAAFFGKANDWPAKLRANATIPITPPLRTSPADGALIEANNPYFQGRLESDDMSRLQVSSPVIYNTTLSIVEAF